MDPIEANTTQVRVLQETWEEVPLHLPRKTLLL